MVGDSFTYGEGPTHGRGYVDRVLGIPVVNLGCGGNGPLTELGIIREYAAMMRPKLAVWFFLRGQRSDERPGSGVL